MSTRWLVDGMNVIGARPDGWWRDKPGAIRALVEDLRAYADASGEAVVAVFDFRPEGFRPGKTERFSVRFADGGPQAADRLIADLVREDPGAWRVVTSDRALRDMVEASGAQVEGAATFRRRLGEPGRKGQR